MQDKANWVVYLLRCQNGSLYCGITNDLDARLQAHKNGTGARYTRANPPVELVVCRCGFTKSQAAKIEYRVKRVPKAKKVETLVKLVIPETTENENYLNQECEARGPGM